MKYALIVAVVWWAMVTVVALALIDAGARWWTAAGTGALVASCAIMLAAVFDEAMHRGGRR